MTIIYDSLTGLCQRFAESLGYPALPIQDADQLPPHEPVFLVTRCFNFGEIPETTLLYLNSHAKQVVGTATSGNRNWGANYAIAGAKIEEIYGIPDVVRFEAMGFPHEREAARTFLKNWESEHPA